MYCRNCGAPIVDGANFCKKCGTKVKRAQGGNVYSPTQPVNEPYSPTQPVDEPYSPTQPVNEPYSPTQPLNEPYSPTRPVDEPYSPTQPVNEPYSPTQPVDEPYSPTQPFNEFQPLVDDFAPASTKKNTAPIVAIVCAVVAVIVIAALFFSSLSEKEPEQFADDNNNNNTHSISEENVKPGVKLVVDDYEDTSSIDVVSISGTISTSKYRAELEINGEHIETVVKADGELKWSCDLYLDGGSNSFKLILTDSEGNSDRETVNIFYDYSWPFPRGTEFVRTANFPNDRIFVRPGAGKDSGEPIYIIDPTDTAFVMTYTGNLQDAYDNQDMTYYYWYEVMLPDSRVGWIRADMVDFRNQADVDNYGSPFRDPYSY